MDLSFVLLWLFSPSLFPPSQMCPLVRIFVSTLDVDFIQNIIGKSQPWEVGVFPVQPPQGRHAALCLRHRQVWSGDPGEAEKPNVLRKLGECGWRVPC